MRYRFLVGVFILFGFIFRVSAQPTGGGPGGGGDPDVPIGGIELLLIAGGALGVRRFLKKDK